MWWKQKLDMWGRLFFRGGLAPALSELVGLREAGVELADEAPRDEELWRATLRHPKWGRAALSSVRGAEPIPRALVEFSPSLTESEREQVLQLAGSSLDLQIEPQTDNVLRERKRLLRFMSAVLGSDGVLAVDTMAQALWTRERLQDEIAHDAPLDILQVHVLHVVTPDGDAGGDGDEESRAAPDWVHSHGLGEMGFVDFDVLRPSPELMGSQFDVLRSIAFHIVEGNTRGEISPVVGAPPISLVDAEEFMAKAQARDRELRDAEYHTERRVVCCDPVPRGLFRRLMRARSYQPSRLLRRGMVEGEHLVAFSTAATELTAERARETLELFERYRLEFEDLRAVGIAKIGIPTDSASGPDEREHLWFEVHAITENSIDATLLNEPFDIARLSAGERSRQPLELLSDWTLMTPMGQLTPRTLELARRLREARPRILEALEGTDGNEGRETLR